LSIVERLRGYSEGDQLLWPSELGLNVENCRNSTDDLPV
jgi:hypothetical protein